MAYQEYELRIYDVPATLLSYVTRMCDVCTAYRTCYVRATTFLSAHIKKRSASAYEEYELRIEEYELRMPMYLRRMCDVPFVSRYAVDIYVSRYANV